MISAAETCTAYFVLEFFSTDRNCWGNISSKDIPSRTGEPQKETKNMLEDKNDKQVCTSTGGPLKNKYVFGFFLWLSSP